MVVLLVSISNEQAYPDCKEVDSLFLEGYVESEAKFEQRSYDEFRSKNLDKLKLLTYRGPLSYSDRKTMVFIDETYETFTTPKLWGDGVTILPFNGIVGDIKVLVKKATVHSFNICLANYYANGKRSIGFHSNNEEIGSVSYI